MSTKAKALSACDYFPESKVLPFTIYITVGGATRVCEADDCGWVVPRAIAYHVKMSLRKLAIQHPMMLHSNPQNMARYIEVISLDVPKRKIAVRMRSKPVGDYAPGH